MKPRAVLVLMLAALLNVWLAWLFRAHTTLPRQARTRESRAPRAAPRVNVTGMWTTF